MPGTKSLDGAGRDHLGRGVLCLVSLWLQAMLVISPPGTSACWPYLGRHHLRIGWSQPDGHEVLHLFVFTHPESQGVTTSHSPSFSLAPSAGSITSGDLITPWMNADRCLPAVSLSWLLPAQSAIPRQPDREPPTPPPRAV